MLAHLATATVPAASGTDARVITGRASSYDHTAGWEGRPTVALPAGEAAPSRTGAPATVVVCADRCAAIPVVDSCPCFVGTADARVANLSLSAWALVTDAPLAEGLIPVTVYLDGPAGDPPRPDTGPRANSPF